MTRRDVRCRRGKAWRLVRAFCSLSSPEMGEVVVVLVLASGAEVLLRLGVPLPRVCGLFRVGFLPGPDASGLSTAGTLPSWAVRRIRTTTRVMRHWPVDGPCLRKSLVLGQRLRRLGPVLRLGVARSGPGAFVAHAWIEVEGVSIDPTSGEYLGLA